METVTNGTSHVLATSETKERLRHSGRYKLIKSSDYINRNITDNYGMPLMDEQSEQLKKGFIG